MILSVLGVYANVGYRVAQWTRECGVQIAIGARSSDITRSVMREDLKPVTVGMVAGLLFALAGGRLIDALLFDVQPHSPGLRPAVLVTLLAVSGSAMMGPA